MALMTPAAYAKSKGLSRQAIQQAMDAERIPFETDARGRKLIDPQVADAALAALTDHAHAENGKGNAGKAGESDSGRSHWINTKTERERINVELARLELQEKRGELLRKAEVEEQIGPMLANLRDEMLSIAPRVAPAVLACKSIPEATRLIDKAIRDAMRHVAAKIPAPEARS